MTTLNEVREIIRLQVSTYMERNHISAGITHLYINEEYREHIIRCGTNILCAKHKIGYSSYGSFVQAVVDNNLQETFSRADSINSEALKFYCMLIYNVSPNVPADYEG